MIIDNIPQEIIDECENLSKLEGKTYVYQNTHPEMIQLVRDVKLKEILNYENK